MKFFCNFLFISLLAQIGFAQSVTIDPNASTGLLDAKSTTKGILIPKMSTSQKLAIISPVEGLMVYDTDAKQFSYCLTPIAGPGALINCNWVNFGNVQVPSTGWVLDGSDVRNTNGGNIGVGVSSPIKAKFEVATANTTNAIFGSTSTGISLQQNWPTIGFNQYRDVSNVQRYIGSGFAMGNFLDPTTGSLYWSSNPSGSAGNSTASETPIMNLTKDGKLGIGTDPFVKFHVKYGSSGITPYGIAAFESNTDAFVNLMTPSSNQSGILFGSPLSSTRGGIIYNHSNGNNAESLSLRTGGNLNRMVINNIGNVAIGDFLPTTKLDVNGAIRGKGLFMPIKFITKGGNYTVQEDDYTLYLQDEANNSNTNITLPNHFLNTGRIINVVWLFTGNAPTGGKVIFKDYVGNTLDLEETSLFFTYYSLSSYSIIERRTNITLQCTGNGGGYSWIKISDNYDKYTLPN